MKQDQRTENGKQSSMFFHDEKVKGEGSEGKILGVLVYVPRAVRTRSSMKNAFTAFTLHPFVVLSTVLIIDLLNPTATTYLIIKQWFTKKVAECYLLADISSVVFVAFDVFKYIASHRNIPPKGVILSDFICTFAMPLMILLVFKCSTKVSEKSDMTKSLAARLCRLPQQELFVAQELIKTVKLKCCGI